MTPILTSAALYAEHWQYVYHVLPSYGIPVRRRSDIAQDVAQTVWLTVHQRLHTFDPALHKSPRAWITGIVRRCAANQRRTLQRRHEDLVQDAYDLARDPGLDPEQNAMLLTLDQALRSPERYEAFLLRHRHGFSIAEIAGITGASESAVEWRIRMAKDDLDRADDDPGTGTAAKAGDDKKSRAFLGFGSLEALSNALQPKPLPPEMGQELWESIAPQMGAPVAPPPSNPPPPTMGGVMLAKGALAALLVGVFVSGAGTGAGGVLAWQAWQPDVRAVEETARQPLAPGSPGAQLTPAAVVASAMVAPSRLAPAPASGAPAARPVVPAAAVPRRAPSARQAALAPASARGTASAGPAAPDPGPSKRLLLQMRHKARAGKYASVLALADEHARDFRAQDVAAREAEREEALRAMRRPAAASARR